MSQIKQMYEIQLEELQKGCNLLKDKDDSMIQNKFLKEQIEILKKEFEDMKTIKDNHIKKLKENIDKISKIMKKGNSKEKFDKLLNFYLNNYI